VHTVQPVVDVVNIAQIQSGFVILYTRYDISQLLYDTVRYAKIAPRDLFVVDDNRHHRGGILLCRYIVKISRLNSYIKVTGAKKRVCVYRSQLICLRLKANLVLWSITYVVIQRLREQAYFYSTKRTLRRALLFGAAPFSMLTKPAKID